MHTMKKENQEIIKEVHLCKMWEILTDKEHKEYRKDKYIFSIHNDSVKATVSVK
jgi:hypothetical protein